MKNSIIVCDGNFSGKYTKTIGNPYASVNFPFVPLAKEIVEEKKAISKRRKRRVIVYRVYGTLTDTAQAYLFNMACRLVISDLNTLIAKEATPYLYELFSNVCKAAKKYSSAADMEEYIYSNTFANTMQKVKEHTYKLVTIGKKKYRVSIIPYETIELTDYGKEIVNASEENRIDDSDGLDLIMEAYTKLLELANDGIITDFDSVLSCANYVYTHLNAYIRNNKKSLASTDNYTIFSDENDENELTQEYYLKDKQAAKAFAKVETDFVIDSLLDYLKAKLPKNSNKENIIFVFEQIARYGKTQREIADLLNLSQSTIKQYVKTVQRITSNSEVFEIVHNMLQA